MKTLVLTILALLSRAAAQASRCDHSADVLFVQDLQDTMHRSLRQMEDDIEDIMEEFDDIFMRPRFGILTFRELKGVACIDIPAALTQDDDVVENAYERLRAVTPPTQDTFGSPLAGLLAALTWPEIQWQSINRIVILLTNNMPSTDGESVPATAEKMSGCYKTMANPTSDEIIRQVQESGVTVLFVIPRASSAVTSWWTTFNKNLGQDASLLTTRVNDLDDWIEKKRHFFKVLKSQNCATAPRKAVNETTATTERGI